ncbi:MAG: hypothetical protein PHG65_12225 [Kiritimatiellae bacterium]|nr:hypothetical protein [Kiritimatiellia bacterium]
MSPLPEAPAQTRKVLYYHTDHLGGSNIITDGQGNIVQQVQYTPYGKISYELNLGVSVNYLYTGQQLDRETGLYYYNARYYDPDIGRFIQPDTIIPNPTDSQAYNRYSYCLNNPVMMKDPSGHLSIGSICDDIGNAFEDVSSWIDDNIIEECRDFVQNNRFVQDCIVFCAAFCTGGAGVGIGLAIVASFNEARPYVGTAVGVGIGTAAGCTTLNPVIGGIVAGTASGFISAYLAGGSVKDVALGTTMGGAVGAASGGLAWGASGAVAKSIMANEFARAVTVGALSGAVSGGAYAAAYGGNVGDAMWKGALVGGAAAGAGYGMNSAGLGNFSGIASGMASGGLSGALNDGDIVKGMLKGAAMAAATAMVVGALMRTKAYLNANSGGVGDWLYFGGFDEDTTAYYEVRYTKGSPNYGFTSNRSELLQAMTSKNVNGGQINDLYVNLHGAEGGMGTIGAGSWWISGDDILALGDMKSNYAPGAVITLKVCYSEVGASAGGPSIAGALRTVTGAEVHGSQGPAIAIFYHSGSRGSFGPFDFY